MWFGTWLFICVKNLFVEWKSYTDVNVINDQFSGGCSEGFSGVFFNSSVPAGGKDLR